jgi:hypothetical protein
VASDAGISLTNAGAHAASAIGAAGSGGTADLDPAQVDAVRKATATTAIFTGLSMVIGAFIASVAAALGGTRRDEHP